METISFNGEHLFIGNLGHFFVVLAFVSALFGALVFWRSANSPQGNELNQVGRITFGIHAFAVLGIVVTLFSIIYNHYFEYFYAWQHSSIELPTHYMISCFWEGQEGSFLLWIFWQVVLGAFLVFKRSTWTAPVMSVIFLSQFVLSSMLLGIPITDTYTFGSSPFSLLRDVKPELLEIPIIAMGQVAKADYLQVIEDGTGLNPLLQNYWMVIHPPTLFFGFASTIIPFAFAVAGLWKRDYKNWMKPALPWSLIGVLVLGTGIIMGGIWAYESLSFGGYWAWDPVENASLVPWLLLIAGVHVMLVTRASSQSLILTNLLILSSFILVLYATFLTRSGVLGDTSVHSFTDLGLSRQLLVFLIMFTLLPVLVSFKYKRERILYGSSVFILLLVNMLTGSFLVYVNLLFGLVSFIFMIRNFNKNLPLSNKEESVYTREFWMFIGALVLILSAIQVVSTTSIPVMNKVFLAAEGFFSGLYNATNWGLFDRMARGALAPPEDPVTHYNKWQLPMAVVIALLTGFGQFMRYRKSNVKEVLRNILITLGVSAVVTVIVVLSSGFTEFLYILFLFAAFYAIAGNITYIITGLRGKIQLAGGSIAHIGFGMMLIGILFSSAKQHVISINSLYNYGEEFSEEDTRENILLFQNKSVRMGNYLVTYTGDSTYGPDHFYKVNYEHLGTGEKFTLFPNAQMSREMGLTANPDTRHYWDRDVFTHVSSVPNKLEPQKEWEEEKKHELEIGDTLVINRHLIIFDSVQHLQGTDISQDLAGHELDLAFISVRGKDSVWISKPMFGIKDGTNSYNIYSYVEKAGIRFNYYPKEKDGQIIHEIETAIKPEKYIVMKAIVFPYINVLWIGMIVLIIGFTLAIRKRWQIARVGA